MHKGADETVVHGRLVEQIESIRRHTVAQRKPVEREMDVGMVAPNGERDANTFSAYLTTRQCIHQLLVAATRAPWRMVVHQTQGGVDIGGRTGLKNLESGLSQQHPS